MDAALFAKMLSDPSIRDFRKLSYKYPAADMAEFISILKDQFYEAIPLKDFSGREMVYLNTAAKVHLRAAKTLLTPQDRAHPFGMKAMEEEISSSFTIERIDFSRDSVRKILRGYAPADESEQRILGMKKGLEFISAPENRITAETIHTLYQMTIGEFLPREDTLLPGRRYRHDEVFVVGQKVEHTGLPWQKLEAYMEDLVAFIHGNDEMDDLVKAAVIHYYIAYLHPWFDGNGRMARLLHLWFLVQKGYPSAMFIPLSEYVEKSRGRYYGSFSLVDQNAAISGVLDVTAFLLYFIEEIYHKLQGALPEPETVEGFQAALAAGQVTEKEKDLWRFVLSAYGQEEFSTKQLEKDYGSAAYATIRGFVLKFESLGLLKSQTYGSRLKYRVRYTASHAL